jgi:hypothetical protein
VVRRILTCGAGLRQGDERLSWETMRVLDNFSTGSPENLEAVGGDVELVEGDIRSYERAHARRWSGRPGLGGHMPIAPRSAALRQPATFSATKRMRLRSSVPRSRCFDAWSMSIPTG